MEFDDLLERMAQAASAFDSHDSKPWSPSVKMADLQSKVGQIAQAVLEKEGYKPPLDAAEDLPQNLAAAFFILADLARQYNIGLAQVTQNFLASLESGLPSQTDKATSRVDQLAPLQTLYDASHDNALIGELSRLYDGPLAFPSAPEKRPYVVINFVTTMEGLISFDLPGHMGGGDISSFNPTDAFVMGLLRAFADGVMVGANTLRQEPNHIWTSAFISPAHATLYSKLRNRLGKTTPNPATIFVTASGHVVPRAFGSKLPPAFCQADAQAVVATTEEGKQTVLRAFEGLPKPTILIFAEAGEMDLGQLLGRLRQELGIDLLLVEGGATLNGAVANDELYDEIFLTTAPQIIGMSRAEPRPLFVEGFNRSPQTALWHKLVSAKRSGDYLFRRYRRT